MLKQRIITGLVLAIVAISAIFLLPALYFELFLGIVILLAAWEWTYLIDLDKLFHKIGFLILLLIPMGCVAYWPQFLEVIARVTDIPEIRKWSGAIEWSAFVPALFWMVMMLLIRNVPDALLELKFKPSFQVVTGWFVLVSAWIFVSILRAYYGPEAVLYLLVLIWAADIAAYFAGKKFGKEKLAPSISPGKTVEGMYGALVAGAVCAVVLDVFYQYPLKVSFDFVLLSVLTVLVSIYGDLFFSLMKRKKGVKDSGFLLPGHGGILDRIDSIIAAAPFYYAGFHLVSRNIFE